MLAAPLAAAALAVFADGGYGAGSRVAFGVAALAAVTVVARRGDGIRLREPGACVLLALAALGAASALWTLGPVDRTLRWALVTAGYAALALAGAAAVRRRGGVEALAGGIGALAVSAAAAGLVAAVAFEPPWAERIAGVWRPGGPFEYPPALALLTAAALPALLAAMAHRSRGLAGVGAVGMALAGGVLALSASRISVALAVAVGAIAIAAPAVTVRTRRATVAAALAVGVAAGLALELAAGGWVAPGAAPRPIAVAILAAVAAAAAPVWLALRGALERRIRGGTGSRSRGGLASRSRGGLASRSRASTSRSRGGSARPRRAHRRRLRARPLASAVAVALLAVAAGSVAFGSAAGRGGGADGGVLPGRAVTWRAAVETFADRPLAGAGADAFLAGSARHQDGQTVVFAHDIPLELAAELGIGGLALALALYAACGRALWRARRTRAAWLLGPMAAGFLVAGLVDWPWHLAGAGATWALALGALAGSAPEGAVRYSANSAPVKPHIEETT